MEIVSLSLSPSFVINSHTDRECFRNFYCSPLDIAQHKFCLIADLLFAHTHTERISFEKKRAKCQKPKKIVLKRAWNSGQQGEKVEMFYAHVRWILCWMPNARRLETLQSFTYHKSYRAFVSFDYRCHMHVVSFLVISASAKSLKL